MDAVTISEGIIWEPPPWVTPFLEELARTGSPTRAAGAAGVHFGTPPRLRKKSKVFAEAWDRAVVKALKPTNQQNIQKLEKIDPSVWRPVFLAELARGRTVSQAAALVGVFWDVWSDRRSDPEFAAAWDVALAKAAARRATAAMRALESGKAAG
jgi:hypothetical protein